MLKKLYQFRFKSMFAKKVPQISGTSNHDPSNNFEGLEIPRYPPFLKGIPNASIEKLLHDQVELLDRIRFESGLSLYKKYYLPAIKKYAEFVHLLPASENHHHKGAGGLLRHGLEVGFNSLIFSKGKLFDTTLSAADREINEKKWYLASFLAGLLHDLGKPISDYRVVSRDGKLVWNPFVNSLVDWSHSNNIDFYFLNWIGGRYKKHESLSSKISDKIIDTETLTFLSTIETHIIRNLYECITNQPSTDNRIYELVKQADHLSTERDMNLIQHSVSSSNSVPVSQYFIDAIIMFNMKNSWGDGFAQTPPLLMIEDSLFITAKAIKQVAEYLSSKNIPGITLDIKFLTESLIKADIATYADVVNEVAMCEVIFNQSSKSIWSLQIKDWSILYASKPMETPGFLIKTEGSQDKVSITTTVNNTSQNSKNNLELHLNDQSDKASIKALSQVKVIENNSLGEGDSQEVDKGGLFYTSLLPEAYILNDSKDLNNDDVLPEYFTRKNVVNSLSEIGDKLYINVHQLDDEDKSKDIISELIEKSYLIKAKNDSVIHIIDATPYLMINPESYIYKMLVDSSDEDVTKIEQGSSKYKSFKANLLQVKDSLVVASHNRVLVSFDSLNLNLTQDSISTLLKEGAITTSNKKLVIEIQGSKYLVVSKKMIDDLDISVSSLKKAPRATPPTKKHNLVLHRKVQSEPVIMDSNSKVSLPQEVIDMLNASVPGKQILEGLKNNPTIKETEFLMQLVRLDQEIADKYTTLKQ